jgi:site-specific DNA-methyltransferase (adenine-specific)
MLRNPINTILEGDCIELMKQLPPDHIAACLTDPPYNYEFIGREWNHDEITRRVARVKASKTLVKNIPYGSGLAGGVRNDRWYERVRTNILEYEDWCFRWGKELFRVAKNGALVLVFNSTRSVAHVQVALERAGFYARDIIVWRRHSGIPKGLNFAKKLHSLGSADARKWEGWHSALRCEWEAICVVQKPLINNYLETVKNGGVGLFHAEQGNGFQSNIIEGFLKNTSESEAHCTVKPLDLMKFLIELVVPAEPGQIAFDPFAGTGTTLLAAKQTGRNYLGIEINRNYREIAEARLSGRRVVTSGASHEVASDMLF